MSTSPKAALPNSHQLEMRQERLCSQSQGWTPAGQKGLLLSHCCLDCGSLSPFPCFLSLRSQSFWSLCLQQASPAPSQRAEGAIPSVLNLEKGRGLGASRESPSHLLSQHGPPGHPWGAFHSQDVLSAQHSAPLDTLRTPALL